MTHAICVICGAMKFGSFVRCRTCGNFPQTEDDRIYSLILSDHYFDAEELIRLSQDMIENNRPHPRLPKEQEEEFLRSYRSTSGSSTGRSEGG